MTREVRLVLIDSDRTVLGELPSFELESPWWPDTEPVVVGARARFGAEIHVLRLVDVAGGDAPRPRGGLVTYEAELLGRRPRELRPTEVDIGPDDPLRARWARPGGVQAIVEWADGIVDRTGPVEQAKTWNLSCLLRMPTTEGLVWCKAVPPFCGHEGAVMQLVGTARPGLVPPVVACEAGLALLAHADGADQWHAGLDVALAMVSALVDLQQDLRGRADELVAAGLRDWRPPAFLSAARRLHRRDDVRATLTQEEAAALDEMVDGLPARFAALEECGVEPTLVHGDFHPGNWRAGPGGMVLLDWADSGFGQPLLDMPAFLERLPGEVAATVHERWIDLLPGDGRRSSELIAPVAALRQAVIYREFLDNIEPSEHRYHTADVPLWLRETIRRAGSLGVVR